MLRVTSLHNIYAFPQRLPACLCWDPHSRLASMIFRPGSPWSYLSHARTIVLSIFGLAFPRVGLSELFHGAFPVGVQESGSKELHRCISGRMKATYYEFSFSLVVGPPIIELNSSVTAPPCFT